jgi:hypothetical protein
MRHQAQGVETMTKLTEENINLMCDSLLHHGYKGYGCEQLRDLALSALSADGGREGVAKMVERFLAWPLPASVCSDTCVTNRDYPHPRVGTNLLTADEARQMIEYLLAAPNNERAALARKAVAAKANDSRTEQEIVADGVKFIMGDPADDNTKPAAPTVEGLADDLDRMLKAHWSGLSVEVINELSRISVALRAVESRTDTGQDDIPAGKLAKLEQLVRNTSTLPDDEFASPAPETAGVECRDIAACTDDR